MYCHKGIIIVHNDISIYVAGCSNILRGPSAQQPPHDSPSPRDRPVTRASWSGAGATNGLPPASDAPWHPWIRMVRDDIGELAEATPRKRNVLPAL